MSMFSGHPLRLHILSFVHASDIHTEQGYPLVVDTVIKISKYK